MINRSRKAFTLLELLVVVVVLGILALVAVPVFRSAINGTTESVAQQTAESIAREADSNAMFNAGAALGETSVANIVTAITDADSAGAFADGGWGGDIDPSASGFGALTCFDVTLTKAGNTEEFHIEVDTAGTPDRAQVSAGTC